ncbi:MAG: FapA family protein [Spirochaetes bacterium]|nr:FapA family protein [Spirochaetota bacterium]
MNFREYLLQHKDELLPPSSRRGNALDLLEGKYRGGGDAAALRPGETLVEAESLEAAFHQASGKLGADISKLSYRILEQGRRGVFGLASKPFRIAFTARGARAPVGTAEVEAAGDSMLAEAIPMDRDGHAEVRITREGKYLVLHPPTGTGMPVHESKVQELLEHRGLPRMEDALLKALLKRKDVKPFKLGDWKPNLKNDGKVFFEMSDDRMKGFIRIIPPKMDGRLIDFEDVRNILAENRVVEGLQEDKIRNALDKHLFSIPILVAEGRPAVQGKDAYIDYKVTFRDKSKPLALSDEEDVDFSELGLIVNVMADEILAEKMAPTRGIPGVNLLGQMLPARDGKDIDLKGGENTDITEDGTMLKAKVNGHAVMENALISVKPVYIVSGDVGPKTGHITNMGSVMVTGKVLDGFNIKAGGNIDVKGTVGSCVLEATGDITIKLGASGKNNGRLIAGGNVASKYLEQVVVKAGGNVVSTEEIMNCTVHAGGSVIVGGKKAIIRGGLTRALQDVKARVIGSPGNIKTVIEVGVPPEIREGVADILGRQEKNEPLVAPLQLDITTLKMQALDEEKQKTLAEMEGRLETLKAQIEEDKAHLEQLLEIIAHSPVVGSVSWVKMIYRGSILTCNTAMLEVARDNNQPTIATVDEMVHDRVKFSPYKGGGRPGSVGGGE